jgi:hypothetical protein
MLTTEQIIAFASMGVALVSSVLAVYAKSKQTRLETSVKTATVTAQAKVDEVKVLFEQWKEISRDKDIRITRLETELKDERHQHGECSRKASRMEGQLAALMNTQPQYPQGHPQQQPMPQLGPAQATELHIDHATVENVTVDGAKGDNE